ncbi:Phosphoribosylformylglycinamidine cyclo-ligase [Candidatus Saccharibacteria bacterium RAAC3_TM7_1]|nr:Phosphoribosylformylglycinamidine cyclo-ligase [Candidatus Saccharibacteria bacterium RAAC3_TM7_1]
MTELSRRPIQDVNIELGDDASKMLYEASKHTHANRPGLVREAHESFSGFRSIPLSQFKDKDFENLEINLGFDGVGTKIEIAERMDNHSTVAHDLFAMVCDDAVVRGAEPLAIGTILDVRQLDDTEHTREALRQLAYGYVAAAGLAKVAVVNGEVAELGDRVGGFGEFNYNWGAAILWVAHKDRILTGHQIEAGNTLVGFSEHGFRSNGITDVRKAMLKEYGEDWHNKIDRSLSDVALGKLVQAPSIIYSGFMSELTGGYDIAKESLARVTGVAHITGGGQPSKIGRMLEPSGLGVEISNPNTPPDIMLKMQEIRGFDDRTAYGKWHMGPGMVVATNEPEKVLEAAEQHGVVAQEIGVVTEKPGIKIRNLGAGSDSEWLEF